MENRFKEPLERALKNDSLDKKMSDFPYLETQKGKIRQALIFWTWVAGVCWRDDERNYIDPSKGEGLKERLNLLQQYVDHENPYIALIAKIERLPTLVWRKILWRYNIDFLSLESFLRRIFKKENAYQIIAIEQNCDDLYLKKQPPEVLKKRIWDRLMLVVYAVMRWLGMETSIPDFNSFDREMRYDSKGAMSYNLAYLDFGFSLYPNGPNDDTIDIDPRMRKFFKLKNHENDFSTNMMDGVYWFMYRFARTLGFLFPGEVKLAKSVCPAFWMTLIMVSLLFLAPVISTLFTPLLGMWAWVISIPTIVWSIAWICKIIGGTLYHVTKKRSETLSQFFVVLLPVFAIAVALLAFWLVSSILYGIWYVLMLIPWFCSIPIALTSVFLLGLLCLRIKPIRKKWDVANAISQKPWLKRCFCIWSALIVGTLLFVFSGPLWIALLAIWNALCVTFFFVIKYWYFFLISLVMVGIVVGVWKLGSKEYEEKLERKLNFVVLGVAGMLVVGFVYLCVQAGVVVEVASAFLEAFLAIAGFFALGVLFFVLSLRKENVIIKKRKKVIERFATLRTIKSTPISATFIERHLESYIYYKNLSPEELDDLLYKVWRFAGNVDYLIGKNQEQAFICLLSYVSEASLKKMTDKTLDQLKSIGGYDEHACFSRFLALDAILSGITLQKALPDIERKVFAQKQVKEVETKKLSEEQQKKADRMMRRRALRKKLAAPFVWMWKMITAPFVWAWRTIASIWKTIVAIWRWFVNLFSGLRAAKEALKGVCPQNRKVEKLL